MSIYQKPFLPARDIYKLLVQKGLKTQLTCAQAVKILNNINFFYLQRYKWNSAFYQSQYGAFDRAYNSHLEQLLVRYDDDSNLRQALFTLINIVEDALKNKLVECFGGISPSYYIYAPYNNPKMKEDINKLSSNEKLRQNDFEKLNFALQHFYTKYKEGIADLSDSGTPFPPIWKAIHSFTFKNYILMSSLSMVTANEVAVQKKLITFLNVQNITEYHNRLDAILWLRNTCAHFDHIIGRSPQYYPKAKNAKANVGHFPMEFLDSSFYAQHNGTLHLKNRCFAWYYQVLHLVLKAIATSSFQKHRINIQLRKIEKIVKKIGYEHLGFDFSRAIFKI